MGRVGVWWVILISFGPRMRKVQEGELPDVCDVSTVLSMIAGYFTLLLLGVNLLGPIVG